MQSGTRLKDWRESNGEVAGEDFNPFGGADARFPCSQKGDGCGFGRCWCICCRDVVQGWYREYAIGVKHTYPAGMALVVNEKRNILLCGKVFVISEVEIFFASGKFQYVD